jgi:tetratricopeptide (TPR) repeat protein
VAKKPRKQKKRNPATDAGSDVSVSNPVEETPDSAADPHPDDTDDDLDREDVDRILLWRDRLIDALLRLDGSDINHLLDGADLDCRRGVADIAGLRVDPRFVPAKRGLGPLVAPRLKRLDGDAALRLSVLLASRQLGTAITATRCGDLSPLFDELGSGAATHVLCVAAFSSGEVADQLAEVDFDWTGAGDKDETASSDDPPAGQDAEEDAAPSGLLFTPLDRLLIRTAVAVHGETVGAPGADELDAMVDEFIHLNADRRSSHFHLGFVHALARNEAQPPPAGAMNEERETWYAYGLLLGYARSHDLENLRATERLLRRAVGRVIADERTARAVLSPLTLALLGEDPAAATRVIRLASEPALTPDAFDTVYGRATVLLVEGRAADAKDLFQALALQVPDDDRTTLDDLRRRVASCCRALNDFVGASSMLEDCSEDLPDAATAAAIETERALTAAKVERLRHLTFPHTDDQAANLRARLAAAEEHLEKALALDPTEPRACWIAGVAATLDDRHGDAASLLERVVATPDPEPAISRTNIIPAARFHGGLATLRTAEPGVDGPAAGSMSDALKAGYQPPPQDLIDAVLWLGHHGSPHTATLADAAVRATPACRSEIADVVAQVAGEGTPGVVDLALRLGAESAVPTGTRFSLFTSVLSARPDAETADRALELLDDLILKTGSADLEDRWASTLAENESVRDALGHDIADLTRAETLRRLGRSPEAAAVVLPMAQRAIGGGLANLDAGGLIESLRELGVDQAEIDGLERALTSRAGRPAATSAVSKPVTVIFVGGQENQARYQPAIEEELASTFGVNTITVHWFNPGWSANWKKTADQVERLYPSSDAVVVMTFVRTNLGRWLRRTSGEAGLPWIPCTGHGRQSLTLAITRAVEVVEETRR